MCHSGFVCDVITSYTTLNSNPEKLQHIYQEANRAYMLENVCVVLSVFTFFYVSNLSKKQSVHNSTGWCSDFLCRHIATVTVIELFTVKNLVILSGCSELLKAIILFLINTFLHEISICPFRREGAQPCVESHLGMSSGCLSSQKLMYHLSPSDGSLPSCACFTLLFIVFAGEKGQFISSVYKKMVD